MRQALIDRDEGMVPPSGGAAPRAGTAAPAPSPPRSGHGLDPSDPGRFAARLEAFRRHHAALPAPRRTGGLQLLDIEELRLRFGARWPAVREKVLQIVEGSLARRLGPRDLYAATGGDRFHLLITDIDRLAAERRSRFIAAEITTRLCGTVPGGVACRLQTTAFDLVAGLAGITGVGGLEARIEAFNRRVDDAEQALFAANRPRLRALFRPVLNLRKRLVAGYALEPVLANEAGRRPAHELCPASLNGVFDAALDRWSIGEAVSALGAGRTMVRVELHYETLRAMRHREPLMLACRRLPASARRRLVLEITGLPASLPQARMRELVSYLRPFALAVLVRLDPALLLGEGHGTPREAARFADHLRASGVAGIALALGPPQPEAGAAGHFPDAVSPDALSAEAAWDHGTEGPIVAEAALARLAALGAEAGLRTSLVVESGDAAIARAALMAGIDHLAGEALLPLTARPGRPIGLAG